jgi:hypothetical protein
VTAMAMEVPGAIDWLAQVDAIAEEIAARAAKPIDTIDQPHL